MVHYSSKLHVSDYCLFIRLLAFQNFLFCELPFHICTFIFISVYDVFLVNSSSLYILEITLLSLLDIANTFSQSFLYLQSLSKMYFIENESSFWCNKKRKFYLTVILAPKYSVTYLLQIYSFTFVMF